MREGGGHGLRDSLLFYFLKAYLQYTPKVSPVYLFTFFFSFACTLVSITAVVTMLELHRDSASHITLVSHKP